ncbi:MAG: Gx transporter family protein [Anaerostipes sp.]|jgi:heptaprenyl diphosphate synthase|nr:Gx transporter family protein [Anaerostipes sp.]
MTKKIALNGLFVALALVVSYIEVLIPIPTGIPGIKIGLANGVIMVLIWLTTWKQALIVSVVRIVLAGLLFGNPVTIVYSLAGGILSLIIMILLKKTKVFSPVGISAAGGVGHNVGQLTIAVLLMENAKIYLYLPVLLVSGTITGVVIGVLAAILISKIPKRLMEI